MSPDPLQSFVDHMRERIAAAGLDLAEVRAFCRFLEARDSLDAAFDMLQATRVDPIPAAEWLRAQAGDGEQP